MLIDTTPEGGIGRLLRVVIGIRVRKCRKTFPPQRLRLPDPKDFWQGGIVVSRQRSSLPVWRNWQTQQIQNLPIERSWGFKSLHRHQPPLAAESGGRHGGVFLVDTSGSARGLSNPCSPKRAFQLLPLGKVQRWGKSFAENRPLHMNQTPQWYYVQNDQSVADPTTSLNYRT